MTDPGFPFLFFGPSPDDWFDEPIHCWQLRFAQDPSPAQRASLAGLWERLTRDETRGLGADFHLPWWWSGGWALVQCRVGDRAPDTVRALFEAMQRMLRAAHAVAPLAEVVYAQASDISSKSAWEAWTVAQTPLPTEAPVWPAEVITHAKKSRKRTKAAVDKAFEAARAQARAAGAAPVVAAAVDDADDDEPAAAASTDDEASDDDTDDDEPSTAEESDEPVVLPEPRGVPLVLEPANADELATRLDAEETAASADHTATQLRDGTWIWEMRRSKKDKDAKLAVLIDGAYATTVHTGAWRYSVRSWSPDRRELLIDDPHGKGLVAATLDAAEVRAVWLDAMGDGVSTALWLAGGVLLVGNSRGVCAWRPSGTGFVAGSYHAWTSSQDMCATTPDRRGLVVLENDDDKVLLQVVVPVDGVLRIAGEASAATDAYPSLAIFADGLYVHGDGAAWRISGIDQAIDALLANPGDTTRFPVLPTTTSPEERADPARNTDANECFAMATTANEAREDATAERWLRRAVELTPAMATAWHMLGQVLLRTGREPDGRTSLERAITIYDTELEDDEDVRFPKAGALSRLRRRDEAMALLRAAITPDYSGNWWRERVLEDDDFAWLRDDPEFIALTTKVARVKRASKKKAKHAVEVDESDPEE